MKTDVENVTPSIIAPAPHRVRLPRRDTQRSDRIMNWVIIGSGIVCFLLLAWSHLGLGAWLFPPAATPARQVATAGAYQVTYEALQLTTQGPNTVTFAVTDASGKPMANAQVQVTSEMISMSMTMPMSIAQSTASGNYTLAPRFVMAGDWRLRVTIAPPGQPQAETTFVVSVRWK